MPQPASIWITETLRHYDTIGKIFWLWLYLLTLADPDTGSVSRPYARLASELGVRATTLKQWITALEEHGYLADDSWNHSLQVRLTGFPSPDFPQRVR